MGGYHVNLAISAFPKQLFIRDINVVIAHYPMVGIHPFRLNIGVGKACYEVAQPLRWKLYTSSDVNAVLKLFRLD